MEVQLGAVSVTNMEADADGALHLALVRIVTFAKALVACHVLKTRLYRHGLRGGMDGWMDG